MKRTPDAKAKELPEAEARNINEIVNRLIAGTIDTREGRNMFMEQYTRLFLEEFNVRDYYKRYLDYLKATGQQVGR